MKLSPDSKEYADAYYFKKCREIFREGENDLRTKKFISFHESSQADFSNLMNTTAKFVKTKMESYILAYKKEGILIDEEDRNEILIECKQIVKSQNGRIHDKGRGIISMVRNSWSKEYSSQMDWYFEENVWQMCEPFINDLVFEIQEMKMNNKHATKMNDSNAVNIGGDNYGNFLIGGKDNTQNNIDNDAKSLEQKINDLIQEIKNSDLSELQKIKVQSDLQTIQKLTQVEITSEVSQEVESRIVAVKDVLSTTADLVSLGQVILPMIGHFFHITNF